MWRRLSNRSRRAQRRNDRDRLGGFTDRARRALTLAQYEGRQLGHEDLGTEHLLLGLLREANGVAARALASVGVSLDTARVRAAQIAGRGSATPSAQLPFTCRMNKVVFELSRVEALRLGHDYIGTEHLLLALLREGQGGGVQVLAGLGADQAQVHDRLIRLLAAYEGNGGHGPQPDDGTLKTA